MKEAAYTQDLVRRTQPPRVTYRTAPFGDSPELGIRHDRAYWISNIVTTLVDPGERDYADVDVLTYGCGGSERTFAEDPPGAGEDPVPWESQSFSVSGSTPIAQLNRIEATLSNVSSFSVDATSGGACIDVDAPVSYRITTNGPTYITFSGTHWLDLRHRGAGTHEDTALLPEPSGTIGLALSAALLAVLRRRRMSARI